MLSVIRLCLRWHSKEPGACQCQKFTSENFMCEIKAWAFWSLDYFLDHFHTFFRYKFLVFMWWIVVCPKGKMCSQFNLPSKNNSFHKSIVGHLYMGNWKFYMFTCRLAFAFEEISCAMYWPLTWLWKGSTCTTQSSH